MIKKILRRFLNIHKDAMSFQNSMDLAELPVVTFHQGEKKINFLLDTGSNNCIIDKTFLRQIKYEILNNVESNLYGMEGNKQTTKTCNITMSYKDKDYKFLYIIQDMSPAFNSIKKETGVTIHGLLGSSFFNTFKYVLDFKELIAYSKS